MTLWDKGAEIDQDVVNFSAGEEYIIDQRLVPFDCDASIAHAKMLAKIGMLSGDEYTKLYKGLMEIQHLHKLGSFVIKKEQEDCHTAIEEWLIKDAGETGKKIHLGRSRNDQVLVAMRLYEKSALVEVAKKLEKTLKVLNSVKQSKGKIEMPGYTHMQRAMPTTVGEWVGAFIDAIEDDLEIIKSASELIDQNPLGTGAGYGIPVFELDREMTTKEMGFAKLQKNPIYAQMSRGKFEGTLMNALTQVMLTFNRMATDLMIFSTKEFGFVELPESLCTGSSIMPQKKNPDMLELVRAKYHVVFGEEMKVKGLVSNLMLGYQRDLGMTKKPLFESFDITLASINIMTKIMNGLKINADACKMAMTEELYATEEAYKLVKGGMTFRDAYKEVGKKYSKL